MEVLEDTKPLLPPPAAPDTAGAPAEGDAEADAEETPASSARTLGEWMAALWLTAMRSVTSESSSRASTRSTARFALRALRRPIGSSLIARARPRSPRPGARLEHSPDIDRTGPRPS